MEGLDRGESEGSHTGGGTGEWEARDGELLSRAGEPACDGWSCHEMPCVFSVRQETRSQREGMGIVGFKDTSERCQEPWEQCGHSSVASIRLWNSPEASDSGLQVWQKVSWRMKTKGGVWEEWGAGGGARKDCCLVTYFRVLHSVPVFSVSKPSLAPSELEGPSAAV